MDPITLGDVVAAFDALYPPQWAEDWDAVGLVCGDPADPVRRILFAVDPVKATVDEALGLGAQLLVTHHPLFLRGVHGVPATTYKGDLVHRLIRGGAGLLVAHTNADVADPGVSDALADRLGLTGTVPLAPSAPAPLDKIVTFVPHADAGRLVDALAAAGAGAIGDYSRCAWTTTGTGTFRPEAGADPTIGTVGTVEEVGETRVEMVLPRERRGAVVAALRAAHPYEEPAFDVLELAALPGTRGIGRVGTLPRAMTLADFVAHAARVLPASAAGIRAAGDPDRVIRTVAVAGGAGDGHLADAVASGADAYLTADLRHHPASEHTERGGPALVDASHWTTERPWLDDAARRLVALLRARHGEAGATVDVAVSDRVTDPWTLHTAPTIHPDKEASTTP
ncbi:MAG TPA: Nif3-like dinuclear metal center hexameric protein [Mycobacteriales bacterium]|nr:Nif3-like dinuclear metal center hexameric protein [Mycobacteriales bacterium]